MRKLNGDCLRFGQINSQSIFAKKDMLVNYLSKSSMDVIFVSETWESENRKFSMNGYRFLSKFRINGYVGVGILPKK